MSSYLIESRRLQNQRSQINAIQKRSASSPSIAGTYQGRDPKTGLREYSTPEGGIAYARYNSTAEPDQNPALLLKGGPIEGIGFSNQKPAL